jgi:GNAT superfamily N-acetyltransferase
MLIRHRQAADSAEVAAFLAANHSARVARRGELCEPMRHPALIAASEDGLAGVLTYILEADTCEILTLHTARQWQGTGTRLVSAVRELAIDAGCRLLRLTTTNDNVEALRFYQRRGFHLSALHVDAVTTAREALKPEIPLVGNHQIPIRDELELTMPL